MSSSCAACQKLMALHARRKAHQGIRVSHPATLMTSSLVFGGDAVKDVSRLQSLKRDNGVAPTQSGAHKEQAVGLWQPPGSFHFGARVNFFEDGGQAADFAVPCG